jgi:hypothetical protein
MEGIRSILRWKHLPEAIIVVAVLLLYLVGIKFLLLPVLIVLNARYLPLPRIFKSWTSRGIVSFLFIMVFLQLAAALQFLVAPGSNFALLAVIIVALHILLWYFIPIIQIEKRPLFSRNDVCALLVGAFFLLPFAPTIFGHNAIFNISKVAGIQAIDATNHYVGIAEMMKAEHLDYSYGHYYPKGFHISVGFIQNTVMKDQYSLGWQGNVMLFFAQYMVSGLVLAYAAYYLGARLLGTLLGKLKGWGKRLLLALSLGPTLALFYLCARRISELLLCYCDDFDRKCFSGRVASC